MRRREFIRNSGILAASATMVGAASGPALGQASQPGRQQDTAESESGNLRFFVISDAHFGWRHEMCPTQAEYQRNMKHLMQRFPDLDFFVDSGDAHHSYAEPVDIENWTKVVQSGLGSIPLHFVAGNHEIDAWGRDWDPEVHACRLTSIPARPYYSFDFKGIHFLVIPQMIMMSYVSHEAQAWAKLDLALNRDKTTIILSHNSLKGTTGYQTDLGYRQTVNSEEMLGIIRENPQVVAWMHGHNHTYELEQVDGVAYVSNGRFGGFNPDPLPSLEATDFENPINNNLGGFLVDIDRNRVNIRAYNCSFEKFFDEMGQDLAFLNWTKEAPTSLDARALPAVSYGHGRLQHGMKIPVSRHYVAQNIKRDIHITGAPNEILNENPRLVHYTERTLPDWRSKHLPGFLVRPMEESEFKIDPTWHWLDPGVRFDAKEDPNQHKMLICPGPAPGRRAYFRCVPGTTYELTVEVDSGAGGQRLELIAEVCAQNLQDTIHREVAARFEELEQGRHVYRAEFTVPEDLASDTIFENGESRGLLQLVTTARFQNLAHHVDIFAFEVRQKNASGRTVAPMVAVGREKFGLSTPVMEGQIASFGLTNRQNSEDIIEIEVRGNRQLCFLIREQGSLWQVRNAESGWSRGGIDVGPIRNPFSANKEVIFAPTFQVNDPYVSRLCGADRFRIVPFRGNRGDIQIEIHEALSRVEVELITHKAPTNVVNVEVLSHQDGVARIRLTEGATNASVAFT